MSERQKLLRIRYESLKNLQKMTISFEGNAVTGIFGPNGCGKTTILHSLLCMYQPKAVGVGENHLFKEFFKTDNQFSYIGSKITLFFESQPNGSQVVTPGEKTFHKRSDHWIHSYNERPDRDVFYLGIGSSVPNIETEKNKNQKIVSVRDANHLVANNALVKSAASYIMNRNYTDIYYSTTGRSEYVTVQVDNNLTYRSLSMGAGEQRLFKILDILYRAPKYSLILIDELDLPLHTAALRRLIEKMVQRANDKNLQIVFTSHREEITKMPDINVRHIYQTTGQTLCLDNTTPDCIDRLVGSPTNTLDVYVEDDLAEAIASKRLLQKGILRHCSIHRLGAATNAFAVAAGLFLAGKLDDKVLILTDGDVYTTEAARQQQIENVLTGNDPAAAARRAECIRHIHQFHLPANTPPEKYIWDQLRNSVRNEELNNMARGIHAVDDTHKYVDDIVRDLGLNRTVALSQIIQSLSMEPSWADYVSELSQWADDRIAAGEA